MKMRVTKKKSKNELDPWDRTSDQSNSRLNCVGILLSGIPNQTQLPEGASVGLV